MVGLTGLEPVASSLSGKRSNRLSYRPLLIHMRKPEVSPPGACDARDYPTVAASTKTAVGPQLMVVAMVGAEVQ